MIPLVSATRALGYDVEIGTAWKLEEGTLMESAALRLEFALKAYSGLATGASSKIVVAAGAGNNGGDGLALLRNLAFAGYRDLVALLPDRELKPLAARHAASLVSGGIAVLPWASLQGRRALGDADLVIDGIAGTGLSGPLSGEAAEFVNAVNAEGRPIVSIDLPSGFRDEAAQGEPCIDADATFSIEPRKLCLYSPSLRPRAGRIIPVNGVFPCLPDDHGEASLIGSEDIAELNTMPSSWTHKGGRGRLAIFAGSPGMAGALFLAARAAQAAGVGLVTLYVHDELFEPLRAAPPEFVGGAIIRPESTARHELSRHDAVLAGPGWGRDEARKSLLSFLFESRVPLVLDADAVRLLAELPEKVREAALVLTPHPGEFEALSGRALASTLASPYKDLAEQARRRGACIALKTATTWLMAPDGGLHVADGGEAGLAVAGSGDVLAGLVAGLIAGSAVRNEGLSSRDVFTATSLAILVHLEAGRTLRSAEGWFEASHLVEAAAAILGRPKATQ